MKTNIQVFVIMFIALTFHVLATEVERGDVRETRLTSESKSQCQEIAYQNPSTKVYDHWLEFMARDRTSLKGFFYGTLTKKSTEGPLFKGGEVELLKGESVIESNPKFLWHLPLWIFSIVLMLVGNYLFWKKKSQLALDVSCGNILLVLVTAAISLTYPVTLEGPMVFAAPLIFAIILMLTFVFFIEDRVPHYLCSSFFYITAFIAVLY